MELDMENVLDTGYMEWRQKREQLQEAYDRILESLPAEHQALLEKYQAVSNRMWEEYSKNAYALGYGHGVRTRTGQN